MSEKVTKKIVWWCQRFTNSTRNVTCSTQKKFSLRSPSLRAFFFPANARLRYSVDNQVWGVQLALRHHGACRRVLVHHHQATVISLPRMDFKPQNASVLFCHSTANSMYSITSRHKRPFPEAGSGWGSTGHVWDFFIWVLIYIISVLFHYINLHIVLPHFVYYVMNICHNNKIMCKIK